jgi:hypothetical protein
VILAYGLEVEHRVERRNLVDADVVHPQPVRDRPQRRL